MPAKFTIYSVFRTIQEILQEPVNSKDLVGTVVAKQHVQKCMKSLTTSNELERNKTLRFIIDKTREYGGWPILYKKGNWKSRGFDWMKSLVALKRELDEPKLLDIYTYQNPDGNTSLNLVF